MLLWCVFEGGVPTLTGGMTHSPPSRCEAVKTKHPRYDCHLALVTSFQVCVVMAERCVHPLDSDGSGAQLCIMNTTALLIVSDD